MCFSLPGLLWLISLDDIASQLSARMIGLYQRRLSMLNNIGKIILPLMQECNFVAAWVQDGFAASLPFWHTKRPVHSFLIIDQTQQAFRRHSPLFLLSFLSSPAANNISAPAAPNGTLAKDRLHY
ncbi:MAG: hypothetical protein N4A65_13585 [Cohaesibacter sp.]|nr:hypothetical protein [Cohaesibacter sp.]